MNFKYLSSPSDKGSFETLEVYLTNSAGIGEHPQIMDEIDKLIKSIAEADGCLETISKYIEVDTPTENQEPQA